MSTSNTMNIPSTTKTMYLIDTLDAIAKPFNDVSIIRDLDSTLLYDFG